MEAETRDRDATPIRMRQLLIETCATSQVFPADSWDNGARGGLLPPVCKFCSAPHSFVGARFADLHDSVCLPCMAGMPENPDSLTAEHSLMALRAETLRDPAGQHDREDARRARGCWCCWLTVPVVLAVVWVLPGVWDSHLRPWHSAFSSALTDPYTLGGVAVTFTLALYGLLQFIDLDGK